MAQQCLFHSSNQPTDVLKGRYFVFSRVISVFAVILPSSLIAVCAEVMAHRPGGKKAGGGDKRSDYWEAIRKEDGAFLLALRAFVHFCSQGPFEPFSRHLPVREPLLTWLTCS